MDGHRLVPEGSPKEASGGQARLRQPLAEMEQRSHIHVSKACDLGLLRHLPDPDVHVTKMEEARPREDGTERDLKMLLLKFG